MPKRFLNVDYSGTRTRIDVTDFEDLSQVQDAVKVKYGPAMTDVGAPQLQIYDQQGLHINKWALFNSLPKVYFDEEGLFLAVRTTPPPSSQPPKSSTLRSHNNEWLVFADNIPSTTLKCLYIRESYQSIVADILIPAEQFQHPAPDFLDHPRSEQRTISKAIITGTPGIGKSLFLFYLLYQLVKKGKRVLFILHPDTIYYDGQGGVHELMNLPPTTDHTFWNGDLWCLFDAKYKREVDFIALPHGYCTFILSTSPPREMINDFKKPPQPQTFYMPIWTNVDPSQLLQAACKQCNLNDCIKIIGLNSTITDKSKAVHSLVHITSTHPFTDSSVAYASQTALDIIVANKGVEAKRRMAELLASCDGNPLTAALCGYIFEPHAMDLLERGGTFTCRELVHGNTRNLPADTELVIHASVKIVADKPEFEHTTNQLYVPKTKNYTAIDAWIPRIGAFQMTVGKTHDIKGGVKEDLAKLGQGANKLYWLLPPLYYRSFTKKTPQDINQYAVRIPYPSAEDQ